MSDRDRWDARHMAAEDVDPPPSELLVETAERLPTRGRALDLACGRGRNAVWLARRGLEVDAVDVSTIGLAKARTLARRHGVADRVRTIEHDLSEGPPPVDGPYDLVIVMHFRDEALWRRLPRLVAPGGRLVVEVLARDATNLDVNPDFLAERDELLAAATGLVVELHGRAVVGRRAVDRLLARQTR